MKLEGKVAFITGGTGGFGLAFGRALLEKGAKVCLADLKEHKDIEQLDKLYGKTNIIFSKCDVTKNENFEDSFKKCEEGLGPIDIVINNAGILDDGENQQRMFDVNLHGVIRGTEYAIKKMGKHNGGKGGHVVNIASVAGTFKFPLAPLYAATKGAVVQYSRAVGDDMHYSYSGVTVLCLCPSFAHTTLLDHINDEQFYNEVAKQNFMQIKDQISILEAVDVAKALLKLLEEEKNGAALIIECNKEPYYANLLNF